nr:disease resistance protein RGA2-like [Coffea arabica]
MAGLGKTTLAKKVYNDSSVICNFHIRLWCTVSQEFNIESLLIQILCSDGKRLRMVKELKNLNEHELLHEPLSKAEDEEVEYGGKPHNLRPLSEKESFELLLKKIVSLPDSIWNMKKLRHVHVRHLVVIRLSSNDDAVENLSTLPNLDTLSTLRLYLDKEGEKLLRRIPTFADLKFSIWGIKTEYAAT